jgi:hypothetical protein
MRSFILHFKMFRFALLNRPVAQALATASVFASASLSIKASAAHCEGGGAPLPPKMYYRMLGNTGLQVSVLSYGFWATFGAKSDLKEQEGIDKAKACLAAARDGGVNLFDNAEVYGTPFGEAERIMGVAIQQLRDEDPVKWRRSDLIITTKVLGLFSIMLSKTRLLITNVVI